MISQAGEWKSPAFLKYLDLMALDRDMVVQAHLLVAAKQSDMLDESQDIAGHTGTSRRRV